MLKQISIALLVLLALPVAFAQVHIDFTENSILKTDTGAYSIQPGFWATEEGVELRAVSLDITPDVPKELKLKSYGTEVAKLTMEKTEVVKWEFTPQVATYTIKLTLDTNKGAVEKTVQKGITDVSAPAVKETGVKVVAPKGEAGGTSAKPTVSEPLTEPPVTGQPQTQLPEIDPTAVALLVVFLALVASAILYIKFSR